MKVFGVLLLWLSLHAQGAQKADLVIFSYDRPLQLYALLESVQKYVLNVGEIHIIVRCSNDNFRKAYDEVFDTFPRVVVREHQGPHDFKRVFLQSVLELPHEHIFFGVDDIIVIDHIDIDFCIHMMKRFDAYGFFLRMGKNCTKGYPEEHHVPLPLFVFEDGNCCVWRLNTGVFDWAYPHTVDMTIYKKEEILHDLINLVYRNPNSLEGQWACLGNKVAHRLAVCYAHSHMVNIPMNSVQEEGENYNMAIATSHLLDVFNQKKKIYIEQFYKINNKNSHMNAWPIIVQR